MPASASPGSQSVREGQDRETRRATDDDRYQDSRIFAIQREQAARCAQRRCDLPAAMNRPLRQSVQHNRREKKIER